MSSAMATGVQPAAAGDPFIHGIDVSHYQRAPTWLEAKNAGVGFVIARATFRNDGLDEQYARNLRLLRNKGIPLTAYHHAGPDATVGDAIAEADFFVNVAQLNGRNLLPALDLKTHGDLTAEELQDWVKAWLARVEERLGVKAMIYAPTPLWIDWMGNSTWFADNGHRFWVRDWDSVDAPILPASSWGGQGWTLWQHGKAVVPGIRGTVDQNIFNGPTLAPIRIKNNR
jgi:GH25 family lysozyme M1 (1,4-beta-N-acetylmuramidase)